MNLVGLRGQFQITQSSHELLVTTITAEHAEIAESFFSAQSAASAVSVSTLLENASAWLKSIRVAIQEV